MGNAYQILNLKTRKVLITQDVKWLEKDEKKKSNEVELDDDDFEPNMSKDNEEQRNEYDIDEINNEENENVNEEDRRIKVPKTTQRLSREMKGLESCNGPGRLEKEGGSNHFCFFIPDRFL